MIRSTVVLVAAAIPVSITLWNLYDDHRLSDVVAHFFAGVAIGAATGYVFDVLGVFVVALALALAWEWAEPRLQTYFGEMTVGFEDTVADVLAVVLGAIMIHVIL